MHTPLRRTFLLALLLAAAPARAAGPALYEMRVEGYGATREAAERVALDRARDDVVGHLRRHHPEVEAVPPVDGLRRRDVLSVDKVRSLPTGGYEANVIVRLPGPVLTELRDQTRSLRALERQRTAGMVVAGATLLALIGAALLRRP